MAGQSLTNAGFAIGESPWLVRNSSGEVITHLDFGKVAPASVSSHTLSFEYRGLAPIKVLGFHIIDIDPVIYSGSKSALIDAAEIIRWGDDYSTLLNATNVAGLSIMFVDSTTQAEVLTAFKSGSGDVVSSPIPYTGHPDAILDIDQRINVTLHLVTPSAAERQITEASTYCFGVDIAFVEIPERLQDLLVSNEI